MDVVFFARFKVTRLVVLDFAHRTNPSKYLSNYIVLYSDMSEGLLKYIQMGKKVVSMRKN